MTHIVSALYCPEGKRYEWHTDGRGATQLCAILQCMVRKPGGEWVDVKVEVK